VKPSQFFVLVILEDSIIYQTAGEQQDHYKPMETFFLSIILEQQMEIMRMKRKLNGQIEVDEDRLDL